MFDFKARHIIEALRSGIPSRVVGEYFSEARPAMMKNISQRLEAVRETGKSDGMIFTGHYGEGKTHLLNTVFSMASSSNMVVSFLPLGKETPLDKLHLLYPKIIANTFLPGAVQPGYRMILESMTPNSAPAGELMAYAAKELETDKLYYLLRALLGTQDEDEYNAFMSDLEGDFVTNAAVKKSYKSITGTTVKFNQNFSKTKHTMDYFRFTSHMFKTLGYDGWVILLDEAELIGRLGKKSRMKTYSTMQKFLSPEPGFDGMFTLFSFSASYVEDVIDKRDEVTNIREVFADDEQECAKALSTVNAITHAPELLPLTRDEIRKTLLSIRDFHGKAYQWNPDISEETIYRATEGGGFLLRTRIRAALEFLDQLYKYGEAGQTKITELGKEILEEQDTVDLEWILGENRE